MEKITKGAVKNGESRREMAEAGGENQSFIFFLVVVVVFVAVVVL